MLLTETYKKRLALSESIAKKNFGSDAVLNEGVKAAIAQLLKNQSNYIDSKKLSEAFGANSSATQMGAIGDFKRFALDLTTIAIPNTIATELVITHPMPSHVGFIQYWEIISGSNKGGIAQGDVFADVFHFGEYSEDRTNYTGANLQAELVSLDAEGKGFLAWTPINTAVAPALVGAESGASIELLDAETGEVKVAGVAGSVVKVKYVYDQIKVPQHDLPTINARVKSIALEAKPRRVAIYFSQMAAFQAKQEQGVDLANMLRTQAVAELSQEIDTEVVDLLYTSASDEEVVRFNKRVPVGVSKFEHFEGFAETIEEANTIIYNRTRKYNANYMVCNRKVLNVLSLLRGWKDSGVKMAGPYYAGSLNGMKVFVHPILPENCFVMGYNGDDMMTSAAVFAPFMTITPTAELQYPDGGTQQGWSTLYDLRLLNEALLVKGEIVDIADVNANQVVATSAI